MALIGFRSPLTYHPWPWSEYTEEQKGECETRERKIIFMKNFSHLSIVILKWI